MANLIQATVYQIDGSPLASPITVDFPVNDIIVRKDDTLNIPAVNSAIQLYSSTLNQISYKTYYVSQTVTTLVNLANDTITSFVKVNVLEINGDPVLGGIDYGFPSNQIVVNAAVNPTTGVNATITYRNNTYSVSQTQASILSSSSGYAGVVLNQLDVPSFRSDILSNIPAPGQIGRMFVSTDTYALYRDSGVSWDLIGGPGTGTVTGSGSAGQVSFWSGASTIVGNSNLYWDNANFRLGIGTTSPSYSLDVSGDIKTSGLVRIGNSQIGQGATSTAAFGIRFNTNGYEAISFITPTQPSTDGCVKFVFSLGGRNYLFNNNTSNDFMITGDASRSFLIGTGTTAQFVKFGNGNVAIGTTTDSGYKLDVSGNIRSNNGLWVTNTLNPAVGVMTWGAFGATNIQIGSWSLNTPVYFVLGSSPRMRLGGITAGDVGQLTVGNVSNSDVAWVSTSYLLALGVSASLENNNEASTFYSYNVYRSAGGLRYLASNPALSFGLDFNKFVWRSAASGTSGNLITFTESMTLDINGRLGIGVTSPSYNLDVNGTARISGTELRLDNGTTGTINLYSATPRVNFFSGGGYYIGRTSTSLELVSAGNIALYIGANQGYGLDATNGHIWRTALSGGAALARLDTGGSLSIGNGSTAANTSSILDLTSTTKGFLPPRMTGAQAETIGTPAAGLLVYANNGNGATITSTGWWGYDGTTWVKLN